MLCTMHMGRPMTSPYLYAPPFLFVSPFLSLLSAAAAGTPAARLDDPRRLRPGEIDPLPEAKPARPDPVDMDEDEKEMLSEARARLANTKGKKAKRKAREKQLEEARRLTVLQKQRELRAAGIEAKPPKKRKAGIDYMEEIPLEKRAPAGFYAVDEENAETSAARIEKGFTSVNLQDLEGKSRSQTELEERKKDAKRLKLFKETSLPDALLKINQINDPQQISRRLDMALPAPQVSERELNEIAKLSGGNIAAALAGGATPMRGGATPLRAGVPARTPLRPDTILRESQNLLAMTKSNSSLLGGENAPLDNADFSGVTPRALTVATPNVLATPSHAAAAGGATLARSAVPATPMRDGLGINNSTSLSASQAIAASRSRTAGRRATSKLSASLSSLPQPQNQFAIVLPDMPKEDANDANAMEEDAEDALARVHSQAVAKREAAWRAESQVIQRGLPRPAVVNSASYPSPDDVSAEVEREMIQLIKYDAAKHPQNDAKKVKRSKLPVLAPVTEAELVAARAIVDGELATQYGGRLSAAELKLLLSQLDLSSWSSADSIFLPSRKSFGRISDVDVASEPDTLIDAYKQQFELTKTSVQTLSKKASKLESNLAVLIGGYQQLNTKLKSECAQRYTQIVDALRNQNCFQMLANMEEQAIPARTNEMHTLFVQQQEKERELQKRYQTLSRLAAEATQTTN